ncbi:hypothetical protein HMPREF0063_12037 [Aeromicrobium marinum DSM 15272]|uniref:ATP-binding protein n=1 Tax=Aeromicrobium marinum DSM 15272 TaxID=585531 RepID=E2SEA1_9ACTN|nr:DUF3107 domain-containing protein [Aeromicrobium marinum]EFQ82828.1 hypothetical protein HMPREF0063_12037 [Aeromicrobium marinum DSM 15272]
MEVKIGVQNAARELSVETESTADEVLEALNAALSAESVFSISDAKGRTVAVPADKVAYLYFTSDTGRPVGFGLATGV